MAKRKSLFHQFKESLMKQARFGESKHEAKAEYREQCRAAGQDWNPSAVEGIFSHMTMKAYLDRTKEFSEWVKAKHGCRYMEEAKNHVSEYIQARVEAGHSPWTLQQVRSALRKAYEDRTLGRDVTMPIRSRTSVTRSRLERAHDKDFSEVKNRDLVDFCRATGLRRHEMEALRTRDVYQRGNQLYVHVNQGKGGRSREVPVLKQYQDRVREIIATRQPDERPVELRVRADIHSYRREYTRERYKELTGREFDRKDYDHGAILEISQNLGHNRPDVVTRSYLD